MAQKRRQRERLRRPLHVRRVMAQIKTLALGSSSDLISARVLLNDLTPRGMGLFATSFLAPGQNIAIMLDQPKKMYLRGKVIWCTKHDANSKVMSTAESFSFRMGVQFEFHSEEERATVKAFCDELLREIVHAKVPA